MQLLKKLSQLFSAPTSASPFFPVTVKCLRCGEVLRAQINLNNDLSLTDDETQYVCRKLLMGQARCFQAVEVVLTFDRQRRLIDKQVSGGEWLTPTGDNA